MRTAEIGRVAVMCGAFAVLIAAPAAAGDLVSASYRLRGPYVAIMGRRSDLGPARLCAER